MVNPKQTSPIKNKNKFKKVITIILSLVVLLSIVGLILFYFLNNRTTLSYGDYKDDLYSRQYKGSRISFLPNDTVNVGIGPNTIILSGSFHVTNSSNKQAVLNYTVEFPRDDWNAKANPQGIPNIQTLIYQDYKNNVSFSDTTYTSPWMGLLQNLILYGLLFGLPIYFLMNLSKSGGGISSPFTMGKNKARQVTSNVKFSDVAGIEEEKLELYELVDYLKHNSKYIKQGARIPRGVLMEGPPGTGKTLLAKAVAGEAGVPFLSISGSEFEEMFVGVGASRIREMFNLAKKNSPSIIFIDEIDAVGRKRGTSFGSSVGEQTLNQLLVEMDGFNTDSGVIVIAATNRVDVLDLALLRPGRFDRHIQIPLPDVKAREEILKLHSKNKKFSSAVDFGIIAQRTPGFSGAQLENVLNEAIILAIRNNHKIISLDDVDEAIDRVVAGPAKKSKVMRVLDKKIVSFHEAGHAVIGLKLENASKVQKVTIIPRGRAGGYTIITPKEETMFYSKAQLFAIITGFLGGRASEQIIFGVKNITTGAHDDLAKATDIAKKMVVEYGMTSLGLSQIKNNQNNNYFNGDNKISEVLQSKIDSKVNEILDRCFENSLKIINENRQLLDLLAESLNVLETITAEQIEYINKNLKLPDEVVKAKQKQKDFEQKEKKGFVFSLKPKQIKAEDYEKKDKKE